MELVTTLPADTNLADVRQAVHRIERLGFDTVHIPETVHDSLAVALLAVEHSSRLTVRTSMTLAFPRSPMITAYAAWDLTRFSGGRFQLGLATQVRGNIVGRFSVPWSAPAERLADYVRALRAIFHSFEHSTPLSHDGSHYRFDRLQPYFNPGPSGVTAPEIWTGGVNRRVCEVAGAVADGFVTHATNSHPAYLDAEILPALTAGAAGRDRAPKVVVVSKCVLGVDEAALVAARDVARAEMAFLYSTPAYRPTLALLGHEQFGERLSALVRDSRWTDLPAVLTDRALTDLVPHGSYAELPGVLADWYGGRCHGLAIGLPPDQRHDDAFARMLGDVREIPTAG
ncbi:LLM class flavin-dependent oxidoreductase [Lentzea sp. E54]|uniref:LLM class flavin-dependent oxidoreductase n=1 Tax=Lentzea xerophila TaxID=3435883 RepID=UPI003DA3ADB5